VSDYIKRLEEAHRDSCRGFSLVYEEDLRSLLSDVERMRGALGWLDLTHSDPELSHEREEAIEAARQALSAPNTEEGE